MQTSATSCAIFCRVIDNFGDAGVCWRLARQLAMEHQWQVTLYIDDPTRLAPLLTPDDYRYVNVTAWASTGTATDVDIVIEGFACELPDQFVQAMAQRRPAPVWINLEYLTAEAWIDNCHALPSPQPDSRLCKYFFFPGFSSGSGGLLRERDYQQRASAFNVGSFFRELGIDRQADEIVLSFFAYPHASLSDLMQTLAVSGRPILILAPGSKLPAQTINKVRLHPIDFLPQLRYDELLWASDVNFVRGEDSFVRAQLAGKPFIWHIYPQADDIHLDKLTAFLDRYLVQKVSADDTALLRTVWLNWNTGATIEWETFLAALPEFRQHAENWRTALWQADDLTSQLVRFCDAKRLGIE